jgi:hypothetical protein
MIDAYSLQFSSALMTEYLTPSKAPPFIPGAGAAWASVGLATLKDDHGNSARFETLNCAGKSPFHLTNQQWSDLWMVMINPHAHALEKYPRFDGRIPVLFGLESPLQTMCHKLAADKFHAAKAGGPTHAK